MNCADVGRLRDRQQIVVALECLRGVRETLAAKRLLVEAQFLNARAHCAIENRNALTEQCLKLRACVSQRQTPVCEGYPAPRRLRA